MSFEHGGRAEKLGNRYEGRWVVRQLLYLLKEDIASVTVEAIGDDEKGVDLWLGHHDGQREAQQCKARGSRNGHWTMSHLRSQGILGNLKYQLDRDPRHTFAFVSAQSNTAFGDLCVSARNSPGDPDLYYEHQIAKSGPRTKAFAAFCTALDLDEKQKADRVQAYDYLKRSYAVIWADDEGSRQELLAWAEFLLTGKPSRSVALLRNYVDDQGMLGVAIHANELLAYLETQDVYPVNLAHDRRLEPSLARLRSELDDWVEPFLINGAVIPRRETCACLDALSDHPVVVLHGEAGSGKSGVLYDLRKRLEEQDAQVLTLRLDRRPPKDNARTYGQSFGLPASPVWCLERAAAGRPSVLILDQLDAIRWTSAHSSTALEVTKELLSQVLVLGREGKPIQAILACRTFDLENDVGLRNWLAQYKQETVARIKVEPLPNDDVRHVVGAVYDGMTSRQRSILANPQNLHLWTLLCGESGSAPEFLTRAELMRRYWEHKRWRLECAESIPASESNQVLDKLVAWLEERGRLVAPSRALRGCSKRATDALCSEGILQRDGKTITFSHQSFLDFLIAERVLEQVDQGGTVVDWLGPQKVQSLARRSQMRLALNLMLDEDGAMFVDAVTEVIGSSKVRFHLKHLVLELIGQINDPSQSLIKLCLGLLRDDYWRPYLLAVVFLSRPQYVRYLIACGALAEWLASDERDSRNEALRLLASVSHEMPSEVAQLLAPYAAMGDDWAVAILNTIGWGFRSDSGETFGLQLQLAAQGIWARYIDWPELCDSHPMWALAVLEILAWTYCCSAAQQRATSRAREITEFTKEDLGALQALASSRPVDTWDALVAHVIRIAKSTQGPTYSVRYSDSLHFTDIVPKLLSIAGCELAQADDPVMLDRLRAIEDHSSPAIQRIVAEAYANLPPGRSDLGIRWLLADPARLCLGGRYRETVWDPAAELVTSLSPHCSPDVFRALEQALLTYRDPDRQRDAEYYLSLRRLRGEYHPYWGRAMYFLLSSLRPDRCSRRTRRLVGWLRVEYGQYPRSFFTGIGESVGGTIGSKLEPHLDRISDAAWLAIISNRAIHQESRGDLTQISQDGWAVSDVEQFSRSLGRVARRYPERFGRLALRFPNDTPADYVSAILSALGHTKPDSAVPEGEREDWAPASAEIVLEVTDKYRDMNERETAISFCRLVRERAGECWPDRAIEQLASLAMYHADPEPNTLAVWPNDDPEGKTVAALYQNSINSVRGCAAGAIESLLWQHQEMLDKVKTPILSLIDDLHPAVRISAAGALLPVLNLCRDQAVAWFCRACQDDVRVAASPHGMRFFSYTVRSHWEELHPLVEQMLESCQDDVAEAGAQVATARFLYAGDSEDLVNSCWTGSTAQRLGVAEIASTFSANEVHTQECRRLLVALWDDPEETVRDRAAGFFRTGILESDSSKRILREYLDSLAHREDPSRVIGFLSQYSGSLLSINDIILSACEVLTIRSDEGRDDSQQHWTLGTMLPPLLLKLYDEAHHADHQTECKCLDVWDALFEQGSGMTRDLTKALDS